MANKNRNGNGKDTEKIVENGKAKGFMTYDEVNERCRPTSSVDQIDDVMGVLGDEDIEIVDAATQVKIAPKRIVEEEAAEKKTVAVTPEKEDEDSSYYSKSNDPVRMYLRKMGSVSLLTREGEVEIAKRIEQGEHKVLAAILDSPDRRPRDHRSRRQAPEAQDPRQGHHPRRRGRRRGVRRGGGRPPHHPPHRQGQAPRQEVAQDLSKSARLET